MWVTTGYLLHEHCWPNVSVLDYKIITRRLTSVETANKIYFWPLIMMSNLVFFAWVERNPLKTVASSWLASTSSPLSRHINYGAKNLTPFSLGMITCLNPGADVIKLSRPVDTACSTTQTHYSLRSLVQLLLFRNSSFSQSTKWARKTIHSRSLVKN